MNAGKQRTPQSIGVIHMNQLGDLVFSLPVLASLRQAFPQSRLSSIVREPLEPLLLAGDLVDGVLLHRGSRDFFASLGRVRAADLDLVVCLSQSPRSRLLALGSGALRRVGFAGGFLKRLLTDPVEVSGMPSTANNLRLVRAMGWPTPRATYQGLLRAREDDRASAGALLAAGGWNGRDRLLVIAPAASSRRRDKEWPRERFADVAGAAVEQGVWAVFVGAEARESTVPDQGAKVIDLSGRTTLRDLMGVLEMAHLFLGIDSGVLHLAAALGTPCVALFGPTDPRQTGPQGEGHRIVQAEGEEGRMDSIATDRVVAAVTSMLASEASGAPVG